LLNLPILSKSELLTMTADAKSVVEDQILGAIENGATINTGDFARANPTTGDFTTDHNAIVSVTNSLYASGYVVTAKKVDNSTSLTAEGTSVVSEGSPEARLFRGVKAVDGGLTKAELNQEFGAVAKIGMSHCMKRKWLRVDKESGKIQANQDEIVDEVQEMLKSLESLSLDAKTKKQLKKRKLVVDVKTNTYDVSKGPKYRRQRVKEHAELTADMVQSGAYKNLEFKQYNWNAGVNKLPHGTLHPLLKVRAEFRQILMGMGFEEMPTNRYVESSFWNFDTLFQPQQHPARDSHDTFFLTDPVTTAEDRLGDAAYVQLVSDTHETGGPVEGSVGWRYEWSKQEASKNLLRTHTTAVSSRMLYQLANQPGGFKPKKYFSIDRVFRNESVDNTHLAEFHQVEGFVADYDLTLGDLMGTIKEFFVKIGIEDVKFKPAYNPYTEPSMEIFGFSKELDKWIEMGNSGIFRPEMLEPMGLPKDVRVIAWGLSLERPTMIKYGIKNIRTLFGPDVDIKMIQSNPLARFF